MSCTYLVLATMDVLDQGRPPKRGVHHPHPPTLWLTPAPVNTACMVSYCLFQPLQDEATAEQRVPCAAGQNFLSSVTSSDMVGWFACPGHAHTNAISTDAAHVGKLCRRPYSCSPAVAQAGRNGAGHRRKLALGRYTYYTTILRTRYYYTAIQYRATSPQYVVDLIRLKR
jgi:hypothetical protein